MRFAIASLTVSCLCCEAIAGQSNPSQYSRHFQKQKRTDKKGTDNTIDTDKLGGSQLKVDGKVDGIDSVASTMSVNDGTSSHKIVVDKNTAIVLANNDSNTSDAQAGYSKSGHKKAAVGDVKTGSLVSVSGSRTAKGEIKADKIEVKRLR